MSKVEKGNRVRALIRIRCRNIEQENKYWLEDVRMCVFCEEGMDSLRHYIENCKISKNWFVGLGDKVEVRLGRIRSSNLDSEKERIIRKLWMEKEKTKQKVESCK